MEEKFRVGPKKLDLSKFNIKGTGEKVKVTPRKMDLSKSEAIVNITTTKGKAISMNIEINISKVTAPTTTTPPKTTKTPPKTTKTPPKTTKTPLSIVKNIVTPIAAPVQQVCETQVDSWLQKPKSQLWIELNLEAI